MVRLVPPVLVVLLVAVLGTPAEARSCEAIRFARGASSATLAGLAPPDGAACYTIAVGQGQTMSIAVEGPNGMAFAVPGVLDNRDSASFTTRAGTYRIDVYQTFRAARAEPFRLDVSVTGGRVGDGRLGAGSGQRWVLIDGALGATGSVTLSDGTELTISCDAENRSREMAITAGRLPGLTSRDGAQQRASLVVERGGRFRRHDVLLRRYDARSGGWWKVEQGLTGAFLDDFAAGTRMALVTRSGERAFSSGLRGTSDVRRSFQRFCGI